MRHQVGASLHLRDDEHLFGRLRQHKSEQAGSQASLSTYQFRMRCNIRGNTWWSGTSVSGHDLRACDSQ